MSANIRISSAMIEALARKKWGENFRKAVDEASVVEGNTYIMPKADWDNIQVDFGLKRSRGVGDTIAKVTKAVGIKPCGGCNKRRAKLNEIAAYKNGNQPQA